MKIKTVVTVVVTSSVGHNPYHLIGGILREAGFPQPVSVVKSAEGTATLTYEIEIDI